MMLSVLCWTRLIMSALPRNDTNSVPRENLLNFKYFTLRARISRIKFFLRDARDTVLHSPQREWRKFGGWSSLDAEKRQITFIIIAGDTNFRSSPNGLFVLVPITAFTLIEPNSQLRNVVFTRNQPPGAPSAAVCIMSLNWLLFSEREILSGDVSVFLSCHGVDVCFSVKKI